MTRGTNDDAVLPKEVRFSGQRAGNPVTYPSASGRSRLSFRRGCARGFSARAARVCLNGIADAARE
jgi:hypothetical protein